MRDIDKYTENYNHSVFEEYQVVFRRKKVLEILGKYRPKSILEIGCGNDPLFQYIDWPITDYTIVEPSSSFIENAKELADTEYFHFINCEFKATKELKDHRFEFVLCSGLLHEVEEPVSFLKEIVSICCENTIVHINVPNANSVHRLLALEMGIIKDIHEMSENNKILQQHSVFDMASLCNMVESVGLKIVDYGSLFIKPFTHRQMYQMIEQKILTEKILDGLYRLTKYMPELGSEIWVNCKI